MPNTPLTLTPELTEEIANLRAEDDGNLRIHDKLQLAENVIQTWTTRAETAEHANSELLERVQKLEQEVRVSHLSAQYGYIPDPIAEYDFLRQRISQLEAQVEYERKLFSQMALAKAPETRNV